MTWHVIVTSSLAKSSSCQVTLNLWLLRERFLADVVAMALASRSAAVSAVKHSFTDVRIKQFLDVSWACRRNGPAGRVSGPRCPEKGLEPVCASSVGARVRALSAV